MDLGIRGQDARLRRAGHLFVFPAANGSSSSSTCGSWAEPCANIALAVKQTTIDTSSILLGPGV